MKLIYYFSENGEFQLSFFMFKKSGNSLLGYHKDEDYWGFDLLFLTFNFNNNGKDE